jgi:hypothetical protein
MFGPDPEVSTWTAEDWEQYVYPDPVPEELLDLRKSYAAILQNRWKDMLEYLNYLSKETNAD